MEKESVGEMKNKPINLWIDSDDDVSLDWQDYMKKPVITIGEKVVGKILGMKVFQSDAINGVLVEIECTPEFRGKPLVCNFIKKTPHGVTFDSEPRAKEGAL